MNDELTTYRIERCEHVCGMMGFNPMLGDQCGVCAGPDSINLIEGNPWGGDALKDNNDD